MKAMKLVLPALLMVVPIQFARAADPGAITVGPNLGVGVVWEPGAPGSSVTTIGVPSGGGLFGSLQPGLRLGFVSAGGRLDIYLDTAFNYVTSDGSSFHTLLGSINLQYNFMPEDDTTAFASVGAGLSRFGGDGSGSVSDPLLGVGIGIRRMVSEGYGALRAELRFDRLLRDVGPGPDDLNSFALKLGVDLWIS